MARILMTGASGAVGGAIADTLAERGHTMITVGRGVGDLPWNLRDPLPRPVAREIAQAEVIVHAAADINLAASYADLYRVNVGAVTELVAAAAAAKSPPRLVHVSSAFAKTSGGGKPSNGYEQTKGEAEHIVSGAPLDTVILRPSLVIGRTSDGGIRRFSGVYIFIRMLRLGLIPAIPGFAAVGVDVVPVDTVAEQAAREIERPSGAELVSITSGQAAPSIEDLVTTACDVFDARTGERTDRPKFVTPDVYHRLFRHLIMDKISPAQKVMLETVEIFLPYFERDHVFESSLNFSKTNVLATWRKSVERWLDETGNHSARGREVWARRR
jgi:nucleoside-diphosphate-sugar epimerase